MKKTIKNKNHFSLPHDIGQFCKTLVKAMPFGMDIVDAEGNLLFMSDTFRIIFGDNIRGKKCWEVYKQNRKQCVECPLKKGIRIGEINTLEINNCIGGKTFSITHTGIIYNRKKACLEIFQDVTERKQYEKKLHELCILDELTKLYNRRGFLTLSEQMLKIAKRHNQNIAIIFIDVDNMKQVNDSWGHNEGNNALVEMSAILRKTCRESDVIGRIGGDEFAVFMLGINKENYPMFYSRLGNILKIHNSESTRSYNLSISIGMADCDPLKPCSIQGLLNEADKKMYKNKLMHKLNISGG